MILNDASASLSRLKQGFDSPRERHPCESHVPFLNGVSRSQLLEHQTTNLGVRVSKSLRARQLGNKDKDLRQLPTESATYSSSCPFDVR